jgi:prophage regulatory protein
MTGVPEGTLRSWVQCGRGPASFKIGGRRVWRASAVDAWIAAAEEGQAV